MCVCSANLMLKGARTHTCSCIRYERMETLHVRESCVVGSQAFTSAAAFNANIGAWNTARVVDLSSVSSVSAVACSAAKSCARSGINVCVHTSRLRWSLYHIVYLAIDLCMCLCRGCLRAQYKPTHARP
jgi:hypothetical protein